MWTAHERRVVNMALRIVTLYPETTLTRAFDDAELIIHLADRMSFEIDVERDLASLPMVDAA